MSQPATTSITPQTPVRIISATQPVVTATPAAVVQQPLAVQTLRPQQLQPQQPQQPTQPAAAVTVTTIPAPGQAGAAPPKRNLSLTVSTPNADPSFPPLNFVVLHFAYHCSFRAGRSGRISLLSVCTERFVAKKLPRCGSCFCHMLTLGITSFRENKWKRRNKCSERPTK